ncbi:MAG: rod shape-determining protein MreD [Anaerolineaceae bacterium]|nr:rod shape-determining protein MreD [Anaerolineaceae bacterium]
MSHLLAGLSLIITIMLQSGVISRMTLLAGSADLILLFLAAWGLQNHVRKIWLWTAIAGIIVSLISAMPFYVPLFAYLTITGITQIIGKRIWETPILAMFLSIFFGTLIQHILYILALQINGTSLSWIESFNSVTLPSLLINMLFAIPVYAIVHEVALLAKPRGLEI